MRFFSILAALLVISLSLLFLNRLPITEKLLAGRIEAIGGRNIQVTVSKLNNSELTVSSLGATFPEDSPLQHLQLQNLALRFSLGDLLKGQVAGVDMELLQIGVGKKKKKPESTFSYQRIQDLLADKQLPPFFPEKISIQHLVFSGPGTPFLAGKPLQIESQILDTKLSVTLLLPGERIRIGAVLLHLSNGTTQLQVDGHHAATRFVHLSLQQKDAEVTGELTSQLDPLSSLFPLLPFSLPEISGEVALQFAARNSQAAPLELELVISGQSLALPGWDLASLSGKLALQADDSNALTFQRESHIEISKLEGPAAHMNTLHFQFSGNLSDKQEQLTLSLDHDSKLMLEGLSRDTLQLERAVITPALTFTHALQGSRLTLHPEFTATIQKLQRDKLYIPLLSLSAEENLLLIFPTDQTRSWGAGSGKITIDLQELQFQDLLVRPALLSLEIQDLKSTRAPSQFHGLFHSKELAVQWKDKSVPLQDIQGDLTINKDNLKLGVALSHAVVPGRIEGSASHDLKQATGKARFSTIQPFDLQEEQTKLKQLVNGLKLPFTLSSGLVDCIITMQWDKGVPTFINSSFDISGGIGGYKNVTLGGIKIQQDVQLFPQLQTLNPGHIFISELNTGLKSENITMSNQLAPAPAGGLPTLILDSIEGELLGGRISSKNICLDSSRPEMDFVVQLNGVVVEEVVKLIKVAGLSATGLIDGNIPVQIRNRKLHVENGELQSRPPGGIIKYLPPGGGKAIPYLPEYVMLALEEFHYDTLSATPLYEPGGTLTLTVHIEGKSPKLDTSRPVHLNLNTEQNLLSLLQSLRYTKNLTEDLEKQIQKGHPKH